MPGRDFKNLLKPTFMKSVFITAFFGGATLFFFGSQSTFSNKTATLSKKNLSTSPISSKPYQALEIKNKTTKVSSKNPVPSNQKKLTLNTKAKKSKLTIRKRKAKKQRTRTRSAKSKSTQAALTSSSKNKTVIKRKPVAKKVAKKKLPPTRRLAQMGLQPSNRLPDINFDLDPALEAQGIELRTPLEALVREEILRTQFDSSNADAYAVNSQLTHAVMVAHVPKVRHFVSRIKPSDHDALTSITDNLETKSEDLLSDDLEEIPIPSEATKRSHPENDTNLLVSKVSAKSKDSMDADFVPHTNKNAKATQPVAPVARQTLVLDASKDLIPTSPSLVKPQAVVIADTRGIRAPTQMQSVKAKDNAASENAELSAPLAEDENFVADYPVASQFERAHEYQGQGAYPGLTAVIGNRVAENLTAPSRSNDKETSGVVRSLVPTPSPTVLAKSSVPKIWPRATSQDPRVIAKVHSTPESLSNSKGAQSSKGKQVVSGDFEGDIYFDGYMQKLKRKQGAHLELQLRPLTAKDAQDFIKIKYHQPSQRFSFDGRHLQGDHALVAQWFRDNQVEPVEIYHSKFIHPDNYKSKIQFDITKRAFERALETSKYRTKDIVLNITVFEAASGNPKEPKQIPNATVKVAGMDSNYTGYSDLKGNVRLAQMPPHSQVKVLVEAKGYYPTEKIVPLYGNDEYSSISLVSKPKVDSITRYFTKRLQKPTHALVMGRAYDPKTRTPKDGEVIDLSSRNGKALYMGALPDKSLNQTTSTGLFSFFNILGSMRVLEREDKPNLLVSFKKGMAKYIEFGRGGVSELVGKLVDPFHQGMPSATVKMVGNDKTLIETDEDNQFAFEGIDFEPGIITLETDAEEYPLTLHTVSWNPQRPVATKDLFMVKDVLLEESAVRAGFRLKDIEPGTGKLAGGVNANLFKGVKDCIRVDLLNDKGEPLPKKHGPFALTDVSEDKNNHCLTPEAKGFVFFNLPAREHHIRLVDSKTDRVIRYNIRHVGRDRTSILVN